MATIDRSRFKPTKVAATEQADKEVESITGKGGGGAPGYLSLTSGTGVHKWRIFPPHPDDNGELYAVPKGVHFLPVEVEQKNDDGSVIKDKKGNPVTEIKNKPVFSAKIHGSGKCKERDIIEEYILFSQKIALENYPSDEAKRKKFLEPVLGNPKDQKNRTGIQLQQKWVMYVTELLGNDKKIFGRLEIGRAVKDRFNKIAATESSEESMGTDPFTDMDNGLAIITTYNSKADKPQDYYQTELYQPKDPSKPGTFQLFPMTDADIEEWLKVDSLKKMFIGVYDSKTFDMAMNGLKNFDETHKIGVFEYEEFLDIADELLKHIPEHVETPKDEVEETKEKDAGDEFDNMDRDELKAYNSKNKLGIIVSTKTTDDMLRDKIREALVAKADIVVEDEIEEEEIEEPKIEEKPKTTTKVSKTKVEEPENDLPWDDQGNEIKKETPPATGKKPTALERLAALKSKKSI